MLCDKCKKKNSIAILRMKDKTQLFSNIWYLCDECVKNISLDFNDYSENFVTLSIEMNREKIKGEK